VTAIQQYNVRSMQTTSYGNGPLIVQSDGTIMLDIHVPGAAEARPELSAFAELVAAPEHLHTYRMGNLTLWNAASAGISADQVCATLDNYARYSVPPSVKTRIRDAYSRFGKLVLLPSPEPEMLRLEIVDAVVRKEVESRKDLRKFLMPLATEAKAFHIPLIEQGNFKQACMRAGFPVEDRVPLRDGAPLSVNMRTQMNSGPAFALRAYQASALESFIGGGLPGNGYGIVVLPCGAGKTVVGMATMAKLGFETLIITPNVTAARQWIREILDKTDLPPDMIGEYSGTSKEFRPVTVASYQILTWRASKEDEFAHLGIFRGRNWGLVIYDEVHLLPAPVFRMTSSIQSVHRLGLTATLVREDGLESDVFSLVGPRRFEIGWRDLESQGFIAKAECQEYRISLGDRERAAYVVAQPREQARLAAENNRKIDVVEALVKHHAGEPTLVIGQYLDQLDAVAQRLKAPVITGRMPNARRDELYQAFRDGKERVLVVSKVANFAIDLPDASVAIQISGSFGSRQEEAQRLGRIMRPKERAARFYTLVSRHTVEEEYSMNRQRFLGEQGYSYRIGIWEDGEADE